MTNLIFQQLVRIHGAPVRGAVSTMLKSIMHFDNLGKHLMTEMRRLIDCEIAGRSNVKQRRMGRTGLKVSEICLGTMTFAGQSDEATSVRILDRAFERGVTFIDTADAYPIPPEPGDRRSHARR